MSQQPNTKGNFLPKVLYTGAAIIAFLVFKNIGNNKDWFMKVGGYWDAFLDQKDGDLSIEEIKRERLGGPYIVSKMVEQYFRENKIKDPVVLMEPNDYLLEQNIVPFKMPEPIIFYNYTGLKVVWMNSRNVADATHFVSIQRSGLKIVPVESKEHLQQILNQFKNYTPSI
jgi:hypothetical protein